MADFWKTRTQDNTRAWPTGALGSWVFRQAAARDDSGYYAFGLIQPADPTNAMAIQSKALEWNGSVLTGWGILGESVLREVQTRLEKVLIALAVLLAVCFWGAFGRWRESVLSLLTLLAGLAGLLAWMRLMNWSWNMLNLMALPLLLGAGAYYTIHVQLALRKYPGNLFALWHTTGRALMLCAATTVTGFGSLAWAGNAGLASMGQVCAVGIAMIFLVSMLALPAWWFAFAGGGGSALQATETTHSAASSIYRLGAWRTALRIARYMPVPLGRFFCILGAELYRTLQPRRAKIVVENLIPVVGQAEAPRVARRLFRNFGVKLLDLWRYEAGIPVHLLFDEWTGWNHIEPALNAKRGVLLVTLHLGNWEFGAPMLAARGVKLLVLTQPEPGTNFTEWRKAARARWGIETFVVGEDPFAFVEIIKCLQNGGAVALLMDRPPPSSAVALEFFGHMTQASTAAADLARASGCALIPAYIPKTTNGYAAHILPEIRYDRAQLGQRSARIQLTAEILRSFEQPLRLHADQWYHFVPLWIR
jgi:lauroyl/myristoyl acyltransferase